MEAAVVSNDGDSMGGFITMDVGITRLSDLNRPKPCPSSIQQLPGGYQLIPPDPEDKEYNDPSYIGRIVFNPWVSIPEETMPDYVVEDDVPESPGHPHQGAGNKQGQDNQETPRSRQKRRAEDYDMDDVEEDDTQKKEKDGEISPRTVCAKMNTSA